jgi:beta-lysine 5,6-aminomutase alpha subunit
MKRPPDRGKGLEGVVERADDYDNPAITALDAGVPVQKKKGETP